MQGAHGAHSVHNTVAPALRGLQGAGAAEGSAHGAHGTVAPALRELQLQQSGSLGGGGWQGGGSGGGTGSMLQVGRVHLGLLFWKLLHVALHL